MLTQTATARYMMPMVVATSVWCAGMQESHGQVGSTHIPYRVPANDPSVQEDGALRNVFTAERVLNEVPGRRLIEVPSVQATDRNLARLRRFRTWGENWDGEGAPAPDAASLNVAVRLLSLLAHEHAVLSVGLDADSRPMFNLRDSLYEGHIVVEAGGELSFSFSRGESEVMDDFDLAFDGRSIPATLKSALLRV